jgi:hypothetical protein
MSISRTTNNAADNQPAPHAGAKVTLLGLAAAAS